MTTGLGIANANVKIVSSDYNLQTTTDASGNFNFPSVFTDNYNVIASKWGYETSCANQTINSVTGSITIQLSKGYYDDFSTDLGWTAASTVTSGAWERGVPLGTFNNCIPANPGLDDTTDCSNMAFVTGNTGVTASDQDVDGGSTMLSSPIFNLSTYIDPIINYSRWFYNAGGTGTPNDSLNIYLNNGSTTVLVETVTGSSLLNSTWVQKSLKVSDFISPTTTMKVIVRTADITPGHIVEAGFDKFYVVEGPAGINEHLSQNNSSVNVYPNPFTNEIAVTYELKNKLTVDASIIITDITGKKVLSYALTQIKGTVNINPTLNNGIYFVRIINGDEVIMPVKILKMK